MKQYIITPLFPNWRGVVIMALVAGSSMACVSGIDEPPPSNEPDGAMLSADADEARSDIDADTADVATETDEHVVREHVEPTCPPPIDVDRTERFETATFAYG